MAEHSIFIGYRRADSAADAGRLYDRLQSAFGRALVFKDVDSIPGGADFKVLVKKVIGQCRTVLILIGPNWLTARDTAGNLRLQNPDDLVRIEVETALANLETRVIPVLVSGASMPKSEDLPDTLARLADLSAVAVRHDPDFDHDVGRLIRDLGVTPRAEAESEHDKSWRAIETSIESALYTRYIRAFETSGAAFLQTLEAEKRLAQLEAWKSVDAWSPPAIERFLKSTPYPALRNEAALTLDLAKFDRAPRTKLLLLGPDCAGKNSFIVSLAGLLLSPTWRIIASGDGADELKELNTALHRENEARWPLPTIAPRTFEFLIEHPGHKISALLDLSSANLPRDAHYAPGLIWNADLVAICWPIDLVVAAANGDRQAHCKLEIGRLQAALESVDYDGPLAILVTKADLHAPVAGEPSLRETISVLTPPFCSERRDIFVAVTCLGQGLADEPMAAAIEPFNRETIVLHALQQQWRRLGPALDRPTRVRLNDVSRTNLKRLGDCVDGLARDRIAPEGFMLAATS